MPIQSATPYLILNGRADRAVALYEQALGAQTQSLVRFGDQDAACPAAQRHFVMHATLRVGEAILMLSDGPAQGAVPDEGAVSVALDFDDPAELRRCFAALASTGKSIVEVHDAPWGAIFGVVHDEFGVSWMLNAARPQA